MDLDTIAFLLEYPGIDFEARVETARRGFGASEPMDRAFVGLARYLEREGQKRAEEQYTTLFDLSPVCSLHVGYHLFGDAYGRGELLAGLVGELHKAGVDLADELPDYLPTLLRLVPRVEDDEDRAVFLEKVLLPGLEKMCESLRESRDPWSAILRVLPACLEPLVARKEALARA